MKLPQLYINVSQTIFAATLATVVLSYVFNKDFRWDINETAIKVSRRQ